MNHEFHFPLRGEIDEITFGLREIVPERTHERVVSERAMPDAPMISIVTPCLNRADLIGEAIESVVGQDYPNVEHIIVDGGSTDGTLDVLARYPHLRVVSRADRGLYDAVNNAIRLARGDIVGWLNSDDWFEPGALRAVATLLHQAPGAEVLSGGARFVVKAVSGRVRPIAVFDRLDQIMLSVRSVTRTPNVNARFFRRTLFERFGLFDFETYPLTADRDFLMRLALARVEQATIGRVLCTYRLHPGSKTLHGAWRRYNPLSYECIAMAESYLDKTEVPMEAVRILKAWHAECSTKAAVVEVLDGQLPRAAETAKRGLRLNPAWLLILSRVLATAALRKGSTFMKGMARR